VKKIEFLQRLLEDGRSLVMSPTDKKALEYCFPSETPLPSEEERALKKAMMAQVKNGAANLYVSFLNSKKTSKKTSVSSSP
jgi:hypothetical protein